MVPFFSCKVVLTLQATKRENNCTLTKKIMKPKVHMLKIFQFQMLEGVNEDHIENLTKRSRNIYVMFKFRDAIAQYCVLYLKKNVFKQKVRNTIEHG